MSLSKDPEGERIFNAHAEALQGKTVLGRLMNDDLLTMKRKLKRMENVTEEYRVCVHVETLSKIIHACVNFAVPENRTVALKGQIHSAYERHPMRFL